MQQIRGMKVKPDSAAGSASHDASDSHSNTKTSHTQQTAVPPRSDADQSKAADKTASKTYNSQTGVAAQLETDQSKVRDRTASKTHNSQTGVPPRSEIDRSTVADKTTSKTRNRKADGRSTESSSTTAPSEKSSSNQHTSRNAVVNGGSGDCRGPPTVTDTSSLTELHLLRTCARCEKKESTSHEFKKCKK